MHSTRQPVAVVVGAASKWQADGRNTPLAHGKVLDDSHLPVGVRWGGGAIAQKFAKEGFGLDHGVGHLSCLCVRQKHLNPEGARHSRTQTVS